MKRQTAVEWLIDQLKQLAFDPNHHIGMGDIRLTQGHLEELYEQAKQIEKKQMEKCYDHGTLAFLETGHGDLFEDYFNKIYGVDQ